MKVTIARRIYSDLRESIISGKLQPGHMLGEQTLADEYGSSKMPVREALHQLCQEGYLVSYPRRGYVVSNVTEEDFYEVQQVRLSLELLSLELIAKKATDAQIRSLFDILNETRPEDEGKSKVAIIHAINSRFHLELARLSGNKRLYNSLDHLIGEVDRAGYRFYSLPALQTRHFHENIVDALLRRDVNRAKQMLREDLEIPS